MLRYEAQSSAPPAVVWPLLARPARWSAWAPQLRGAWGLGAPEVRVGAVGAARLLGVLPVPAVITGKEAGRAWSWRVGPVALDHRVEPTSSGSRIEVVLRAPGPLEALLGVTYGPVIALLLANLARVAEREG